MHLELKIHTCCVEKNVDQQNGEDRPQRFPQAPKIPADPVQHLQDFVVALVASSSTQLFLLSIAEGQTRGQPPKVLAEEALVARGECSISLDICAAGLG